MVQFQWGHIQFGIHKASLDQTILYLTCHLVWHVSALKHIWHYSSIALVIVRFVLLTLTTYWYIVTFSRWGPYSPNLVNQAFFFGVIVNKQSFIIHWAMTYLGYFNVASWFQDTVKLFEGLVVHGAKHWVWCCVHVVLSCPTLSQSSFVRPRSSNRWWM